MVKVEMLLVTGLLHLGDMILNTLQTPRMNQTVLSIMTLQLNNMSLYKQLLVQSGLCWIAFILSLKHQKLLPLGMSKAEYKELSEVSRNSQRPQSIKTACKDFVKSVQIEGNALKQHTRYVVKTQEVREQSIKVRMSRKASYHERKGNYFTS